MQKLDNSRQQKAIFRNFAVSETIQKARPACQAAAESYPLGRSRHYKPRKRSQGTASALLSGT
jgi:hypothetical protein